MSHKLKTRLCRQVCDLALHHVSRKRPQSVMGSFLRRASFVSAAMCIAAPAFAICAGNQETVFSCTVQSKTIELCLTPLEQSVTYRFGPASAPEIELTRGFGEINMRPWNGIGRHIWNSVQLPNEGFSYELYWAFDKIEREAAAGLNVLRGEQELATVECSNIEETAVMELETLQFAMEDAGFCRVDTSDALAVGACE
jgi:hypothetical protein